MPGTNADEIMLLRLNCVINPKKYTKNEITPSIAKIIDKALRFVRVINLRTKKLNHLDQYIIFSEDDHMYFVVF